MVTTLLVTGLLCWLCLSFAVPYLFTGAFIRRCARARDAENAPPADRP